MTIKESILDYLKKCNNSRTSSEIAHYLIENDISVNSLLMRLKKENKVISEKFYNGKRAINIYRINK